MDPVKQFEELWRKGPPPDLWQFLDGAGPLPADGLVQILLTDRDERWRRGERVPAEAYLQRRPDLTADPPRAVDLVYSEYRLRKSRDEPVEPDEYLRRFPQYAAALRLQFAVAAEMDGLVPTRPAATAPVSPLAPAVPGYEVLERLGSGGMGVVYKARQVALNRIVALKMLRDAEMASAEERERFRAEAETIARSSHPHIVQVFEVGERPGGPFFSMEFCPGGSLDRKLNGKPLPPRDAAALLESLAGAVHAAHAQKVVHRDLKPANVLLAADGTPKVSDFGLAKQLDAAGRTATGSVIGTVNYMAPEQASGRTKEVGPAADVYALGAILFECLTGRPPFQAPTEAETLLRVLDEAPPRPRLLQPGTPRDLETICLKCLEKDPRRRYASARDLAEDLRRFLDGRPIAARPTPSWERGWRWCRRKPAVASLLAAVAVAVVLGLGFSWYFAWSATEESRQKRKNLRRALLGDTQLAWEEGRIDDMRKLLREQQLVDGGEGRLGFEWYYWQHTLRRERHGFAHPRARGGVGALAVTSDGRLVSAAFRWRLPVEVRAGDLAGVGDGVREVEADGVTAVALSGAGDWLAVASWTPGPEHEVGRVFLYAVTPGGGTPELRLKRNWGGKGVNCVAFSPDGRWLAAGGENGHVAVWPVPPPDDRADGTDWEAGASRQGVDAVAFGPDGLLAVAVAQRHNREETVHVQLWRLDGGARPHREGGDWECPAGTACLAFTGERVRPVLLAAGDGAGTVHLRDLAGKQECSLATPRESPVRVTALAFTPDGTSLAAGRRDHTVQRWELRRDPPGGPTQGVLTETLVGHSGSVTAAAFCTDGNTLVTGGQDGAVKVWDVPRNRPPDTMAAGRKDGPLWGAFAPDGRLITAGANDGRVQVWEAEYDQPHLLAEVPGVIAIAPSRDLLAAGVKVVKGETTDYEIRLYDTHTGELIKSQKADDWMALAVSPDGRTLAAGVPGKLTLLDLPALTPSCSREWKDMAIQQLAFNRDGTLLAAAGGNAGVGLWPVRGGVLGAEREVPAPPSGVLGVAFSPAEDRLAAGCDDDLVLLWDVRDPEHLTQPSSLRGHTGRVRGVAFSADGKTLASGSDDRTVKLWSVGPEEPHLAATLRGHADGVGFVSFCPAHRPEHKGRSPVLVSGDMQAGSLRVWRAAPDGR